MFGLIVLFLIGLYLLMSVGVVRWAISYARKNGKSAKRWGWGAALGMYLLVFWDWIPTVVAHKYYCSTEAGFWLYKTPEQWKKENPEGLEEIKKDNADWSAKYLEKWKLSNPSAKADAIANMEDRLKKNLESRGSERQGDMENYTDTYILNQRINQIVQQHKLHLMLAVNRRDLMLVDSRTKEVLARYVDFGSHSLAWGDLRFWTSIEHCSNTEEHNDVKFYEFENQLTGSKK